MGCEGVVRPPALRRLGTGAGIPFRRLDLVQTGQNLDVDLCAAVHGGPPATLPSVD